MNKGDARMLADGARETLRQMDALETELGSWTRNLEKAATAYLKAQHRLPRAGQWAHIRPADDPFEMPGQIHFHVSNGIDTHDDFGAFLTFEQLERDPEEVAAAYEREQVAQERKAARQDLAAARARAKRAGVKP